MAIVTHAINSYAVNDTSAFVLTHKVSSGVAYRNWTSIGGLYYVNSDTLTDFGLIEFSADSGKTWIDLVHDTTGLVWWDLNRGHANIFSGNSHGWKKFYCELHFDGTPYAFNIGDTIKFRFSFITDSIDNPMDGLMFDDLRILDDDQDEPVINDGAETPPYIKALAKTNLPVRVN